MKKKIIAHISLDMKSLTQIYTNFLLFIYQWIDTINICMNLFLFRNNPITQFSFFKDHIVSFTRNANFNFFLLE